MDIGQLLLAAVGGGTLGTGAVAFFQRKKLGADTAAVLSETAMELLPPLRNEIKELRAEITELRAQVRQATEELDQCRADRRVVDAELDATRERERAKDDLISQLTRPHP